MSNHQNKNQKSYRKEKAVFLAATKKHQPKIRVKNTSKTSSTKIHTDRTRIKISHPAASREKNRKFSRTARRLILFVIAVSMLVVILALLLQNFSTPERVIKRDVESIVSDYYENYFYQDIIAYAPTDKSLDEIMERYARSGFSSITLRQLLLSEGTSASNPSALTTYCDAEETYFKIYPYSPYGKTDYRVDYHYSCNF